MSRSHRLLFLLAMALTAVASRSHAAGGSQAAARSKAAGTATVASAAAAVSLPTNFVDEQVVGTLNQPRAFVFLPDGRILIAEQHTGAVRLVVSGHLSTPDPAFTVPNVNGSGYERGLQGIAVDPQFPSRPYVYVFHNGLDGHNHLVRYTVGGSIGDPVGQQLSISTPLEIISDIPDDTENHQGGCLRFGPDGMLYLSLGDDDLGNCVAQDSTSLRGEILRLMVSGLGSAGGSQPARSLITPPGNPLTTTNANAKLVWAYGLRNPWCYGMDPDNGTIYTADVGEDVEEELDEIQPGKNYGWPWREGLTIRPVAACPEPGGAGNAANGFKAPIMAYARDQQMHAVFSGGVYRAVPGGAFNWPALYRGNLFWGDYYFGTLHRLERNLNNLWVEAPSVPGQPGVTWATGFTSACDFRVGPDASLYWLQQFTSTPPGFGGINGVLHRLRYTGTPVDTPPGGTSRLQFACSPNPASGPMSLSFSLPSEGRATLAIYDLAGRRVATPFDRDAPAGVTSVSWDGETVEGGRAPAGLYLARLDWAGRRESLRLLRVR